MSIQLKAQLLDARKDPEKPQCDLPELPLVRWSDGTKPAGRFVRCNKNDQQNPQGLASYGFKVRGVVHVFDLKITQKSRNHNFSIFGVFCGLMERQKNPSTWETQESLLKTRHSINQWVFFAAPNHTEPLVDSIDISCWQGSATGRPSRAWQGPAKKRGDATRSCETANDHVVWVLPKHWFTVDHEG